MYKRFAYRLSGRIERRSNFLYRKTWKSYSHFNTKRHRQSLLCDKNSEYDISLSSRLYIEVFDIVTGKEIVYHDVWCGEENEPGQIPEYPARFYSDPELLKKALSLQTSTRIYSGLICSGDQFITTRKELDKIKATFPNGLAVDMESASIAHVCYMNKIPFLSFRIISDTPGIEDHTTQYNRFWEEAPQKIESFFYINVKLKVKFKYN